MNATAEDLYANATWPKSRKVALGMAVDMAPPAALNGYERAVLQCLIRHENPFNGQCNPSIATIAREIGFSERTVYRAMERLLRDRCVPGLTILYAPGNSQRANSYRIVWNPPTPKAVHQANNPDSRAVQPQKELQKKIQTRARGGDDPAAPRTPVAPRVADGAEVPRGAAEVPPPKPTTPRLTYTPMSVSRETLSRGAAGGPGLDDVAAPVRVPRLPPSMVRAGLDALAAWFATSADGALGASGAVSVSG